MTDTTSPGQNHEQPVSAPGSSVPAAGYRTQADPQPGPHPDPDEINLLEYAYVLVKAKWWIVGMTLLGLVGGYVAALIKGPTWVATAVVAPRETQSQKSPNLSGLGMFGGIVASQLSLGGNASLENIEIVLDSRKFNAEMVEEKQLLPLIYAEEWDSTGKKWKDDFEPPQLAEVGGFIKEEYFERETNKNNTMNIAVKSSDSLFSCNLLSACLEHLDLYIREDVENDARENRDYLEKQLVGVTDPLLRNKIQGLIAGEVEKMMVVSKEAFRVIDPAFTSKSYREKKLFPLVFGFGLFFLTVLWMVFGHALFSADKTEDDKRLIGRIREDLLKMPFSR